MLTERRNTSLYFLTALVLALGMLPSLTALSAHIAAKLPRLSAYLGPINFLKVGAPVLWLYFWSFRKQFSDVFWVHAIELVFFLSLGTVMAAVTCKVPPVGPALYREFSVILLGGLAALCFLLLREREQKWIMGFWLFAIYGGALLDALYPPGATWFYDHIFDPKTRDWDLIELGKYPLTGVFGRQSLAKMMAWVPWIAMVIFRPKRLWPWLALAGISTASILATTQRGPFVGAVAGWIVFILHQLIQRRQARIAKWATIGLVLAIATVPLFVPQDILISRVKSLINWNDPHSTGDSASGNIGYRFQMTRFSMLAIQEGPWGNACISTPTYWLAGIWHAGHSHSMVLHQFRERGWIWGSIHLLLWIYAFVRAWKIKHYLGSPIVAAVGCALVLGFFDHPWFVLNQALILWIILLMALLPQKTLSNKFFTKQ